MMNLKEIKHSNLLTSSVSKSISWNVKCISVTGYAVSGIAQEGRFVLFLYECLSLLDFSSNFSSGYLLLTQLCMQVLAYSLLCYLQISFIPDTYFCAAILSYVTYLKCEIPIMKIQLNTRNYFLSWTCCVICFTDFFEVKMLWEN